MPLGMSSGSSPRGHKSGTTADLSKQASHGSGSKGSLKTLLSGTKRGGKMSFPSMGRGPLRK